MRLPVLLALVLILSVATSCSDTSSGDSTVQQASIDNTEIAGFHACPESAVVLDDWERLTSDAGHFSFVVPRDAKKIENVPTVPGFGETWRADGLTLLYRIRREPREAEQPSSVMENVLVCQALIGGRDARVFAYYSDATIIPGQFVFGTWQLNADSLLIVHGQSRNRAARDTLLAVLYSVRF